MSLSKVISKGETLNLERWHVPAVDQKGVSEQQLLTAKKLEALQKQAQQEGYQQGYQQGLVKGERDVQRNVAQLTQIFNVLQKPLGELDEQVHQRLVELAVLVAGQVIRRELKTEPAHIVGIVREAVGALPMASRTIRIHLHPDDANVVRQALSGAQAESGWQIVDDTRLSRGDCKVTSETSQVDATLARRVAEISAMLLGGERESDSSTDDSDGSHE